MRPRPLENRAADQAVFYGVIGSTTVAPNILRNIQTDIERANADRRTLQNVFMATQSTASHCSFQSFRLFPANIPCIQANSARIVLSHIAESSPIRRYSEVRVIMALFPLSRT